MVDGARRSVHPSTAGAFVSRFQNLLTDAYPRGLDLVLCRNVLIYFDAATRTRVLEQLFGAVREGGYVALGLRGITRATFVAPKHTHGRRCALPTRRRRRGAGRRARGAGARARSRSSPLALAAVSPVKGPPLGQLEGELEGALGLARTLGARTTPSRGRGARRDPTALRGRRRWP
ncbi:MAG: CheR family methyltransferase [Polyangiales bacterium]